MEELKSKKWRSLVLSVGTLMFEHSKDAPWYVIVSVAAIACSYLVSQGLVDYAKVKYQVEKSKKNKDEDNGASLRDAASAER